MLPSMLLFWPQFPPTILFQLNHRFQGVELEPSPVKSIELQEIDSSPARKKRGPEESVEDLYLRMMKKGLQMRKIVNIFAPSGKEEVDEGNDTSGQISKASGFITIIEVPPAKPANPFS